MAGVCKCKLVVVVVSMMMMMMMIEFADGQQSYVNNKQNDCYNSNADVINLTRGFECNGIQPSCDSYITFRSSPPYNTPALISYLLSSDSSSASLIASLNNISSDVSSIPQNTLLIAPLNCSCFNNTYYQHNASYLLKLPSETYFSVANNTYQGLSTCQALMSQNPFGDRNLTVGLRLRVPLRCACPTSNQSSLGFKYLLTYLVNWGDDISSIAQLFGVHPQSILDANELSSKSLIFPFTPLLVPLTTQPTIQKLSSVPPPAAPSPQIPIVPPPPASNNNKWIYVGASIGASALLLFLFFGFLFWYRHKKPMPMPIPTSLPNNESNTPSQSDSAEGTNSWSLSSQGQAHGLRYGLRYAIESLTPYEFHELQVATDSFSDEHRIKGSSVYKGSFKGDEAAVKVMKGEVSSEISILKKTNHSNIVRLSGFCLHHGNTYLVYEFAHNGALNDWLLHKNQSLSLTWKQRVQIAHDVADALNYLHNYTHPPYIHKNLKTSNILLDANFRAKISNFGLARTVQNEGQGIHLTRHVVGTQGYMAPEYLENGVITPKLDVFAFGVVIAELLSGKEAAAPPGDKNNAAAAGEEMLSASICRVLEGDNVRQKFSGFMDPSLGREYPLDLAFSVAQLAHCCVSHDINARPSISQVFISLSKILASSLDWDPSSELQHSNTSMSSCR